MLLYVDTFPLYTHFNVHLKRIQSPEEGGITFLRNVGMNLLRYMFKSPEDRNLNNDCAENLKNVYKSV